VATSISYYTSMVRPRVFFDFSVDGAPLGRVTFELFNDTAPKTAENFRALCTGEKGVSPISDRPLYYKNSIIHKSIAGFMLQGGDFTKRDGSGGESIYGSTFPDEDLTRELDSEGLLVMSNRGSDTNNSQFFITLTDRYPRLPPLVVFGKVIRGYEVVQKINQVPVDANDRPKVPVAIYNCGELELRKKQEDLPQVDSKKHLNEASSEFNAERRRRKNRSDSLGEASSRRPQKRSKHKKHRSLTPDDGKVLDTGDQGVVAETEEEYDARLEREENERRQAERKKELGRIRRQYEDAPQSTNGVRFKGRGRMKYIDPEFHRRHG